MTRPPDAPDPDEGPPQSVPAPRPRGADVGSLPTLDSGRLSRPSAQPLAHDRLGDFRIDRRLGAGGMGEVFAATHVETGQRLALKVLRITSPTLLYRFKREFRALADITHPNVAGLYELFVPTDGSAFFTMELVEGRPFTAYVRRGVRAGELPDLARLEAALLQLVRGVHHLHRARCIHRDLKPSNVLVTADGRVVILDFGLVSEQFGSVEGVTGDGQLLGTPAYMAPEQANAEVSPAIDYYAIGVMLYQCLTGELPFSGAAMKVILLKQDKDAPDPAVGGLDVPEHLRELCRRLLQRDPALRPTGRELLELLEGWGTRTEDTRASVGDTRLVRRFPFVDREAELRTLAAALDEVAERGASITIHVHGPSGHGKSALVGQLLGRARNDEQALVLGGRCFERVWVPFKGVDTVVDALSVHLRRMTAEQRAEARPRHLSAMVQIFPVLADIWETPGDASRSTTSALEPSERMRLGLLALREVFVRLGSRWTLVVLIDDLQWTNLDGVKLLTTIMQPPDPPAMLLVLAFRDERAGNPGLLALTEPGALEGRDVRELAVGPLPDEAVLELARALTSDAGSDETRVQELVRFAHGSPAKLRQLLADERPLPSAAPTVDRISELAPAAKRVLACVALAVVPLSIRVVTEVLPDVDAHAWLEDLSLQGLVSIRESGHGDREHASLVEASQAWIRDVALTGLDEDERRSLHRALAAALERRGADPETLAEHYAEGGQPEAAALHTERAADQAAEALAFAEAAALYRRAQELLPSDAPTDRRQRLRRALARQLVNLGHGAEPATILLELAHAAEPGESVSLRREAAVQLARSGRLDESTALTTELLERLGEPTARPWWRALASWLGAWPRRSWHAHTPGQGPPPSPAQLERLDVLLSAVDAMRERTMDRTLHERALALAIELGEPMRLARALAHEISAQAARGRHRRTRALAIEARELAARVADLELDLELDIAALDVDWLEHRHLRALERLELLLNHLDEVPGSGWMRSHVVTRYVEVRILLGRYAELRLELPGLLATARDRGNLHEVVALEAHATTVALRYGDFAKARRHLAAGRSARTTIHHTFAAALLDNAEIDWHLSAGELDEALGHVEQARAALRRSGLARARFTGDAVDRLHARGAIQALLSRPGDRILAAQVEALGRKLRRSPDPALRGQAMLDAAASCSLAGNVEGASRAWRRAHEHFEAEGMRAHLAATRMRLAAVTSAHESNRLMALAEAYFSGERIAERERFVDAFAPAAMPIARERDRAIDPG